MKYIVSYSHPSNHYIDIQVEAEVNGSEKLNFQLPAWRPGRYELGNFAKNIQKLSAFDENGKSLSIRKPMEHVDAFAEPLIRNLARRGCF